MPEELLYKILIDALPIGFLRVDAEGKIVDFNRAAETLTGYAREEAIGKSYAEIFHCSAEKGKCSLTEFALERREQAVAKENFIRRKTGDCILLSITTAPFYDLAGDFQGGIELFTDISETSRLTRERKNILAMFAHDMKNPLTAASGFVGRLLAGKVGPTSKKQLDYLGLIREELNRLEDLVTDFLEFSRFEAAECRPAMEQVDMINILRAQVARAGLKAEEKKLTLAFECPGDDKMPLVADPRLIARVIDNLLDNAIRYSRPGGAVTVSLSQEEDSILVRVGDMGIGVSENHIPYLFDAFYRVSRESAGSGLGLAIARTIVEAHGGKIWVESMHGGGVSSVLPFRQQD